MSSSDVPVPNVSPTALHLHAAGLLASFEAGHAGLVDAEYLAALGDDCAAAVAELVRCGVWQPVPTGYQVIRSEALRMASEVDRLVVEAREQLRHNP